MSSPRWHKIIRDLWQNRVRTLLVVAAIAIGVFSIGVMSTSYSILMRELRNGYLATNPASAVLLTDSLDDDFIANVRNLPEIADAEARSTVVGRLLIGPDEWRNIWLFVINDFDDIRIGIIEPERGTWPPGNQEILIERAALSLARADIGNTVVIKTPNGPERELLVSGTAHDVGVPPAWQENLVFGYITLDTLEWLGESRNLNELRITVAENAFDEKHVRSTTNQLKAWIENRGRQVYRIQVPPPGEHPHQFQMNSFLLIMQSFGLLALFLSSILVVNMVSALLAQQIRQIGMMKAVGATTRQIASIYFGLVLILGLVALVLAMPAGIWVGRAYSAFVADMFNFDIVSNAISPWAFVLQVLVSLLVPILASARPIYKGSRVTVHRAICDYGVGEGKFGTTPIELLLGRLGGLGRPLLLSIRNTFRRRGRLMLTLSVLTMGGAIFMAAMNMRTSINSTLEVVENSYRYDIQISFSRPYPVENIERAIRQVPGVVQVESTGGSKASLVYPDGTGGNPIKVLALSATTEMVDFPMMEGRWLLPGDENVVVLNHMVLVKEPDIHAGDEIVLRIDGQETTWRVVGIVEQVISAPTIYVSSDYLGLFDQVGYATNAFVVTKEHDATSHRTVMPLLEQALEGAGLDVSANDSVWALRKVIEEHLFIIVALLVLMTSASAIVGGLGLMTTMSINILERTREIGVMRAIGASNYALLRIIMGEGASIGLLSWLMAVVLTAPISILFGNLFGRMIFDIPLGFTLDPQGLVVWLVIVVVFSALASFLPAWQATRLTVHKVLAYE